MLAADERDVVAEFLDEFVDEHAAMFVLFRRHILEDTRGVGIVLLQAFGKVGVDAAVLLLVADRQRQDFAFGQVREGAHGNSQACLEPI